MSFELAIVEENIHHQSEKCVITALAVAVYVHVCVYHCGLLLAFAARIYLQ